LGNVIRRPQQHQEDRRGGGAYRYTHGRSERPGVCGARFRRHAEYAGCPPGAAASGSTHRCTTAATASPSTSAGSAEGWLQRLLLWQLWQSGRRRWRLENYEPPLTIWTTQWTSSGYIPEQKYVRALLENLHEMSEDGDVVIHWNAIRQRS
jgi:hypothetical protein